MDPDSPAVLTNHELLSLSYFNAYRDLRWNSGRKFDALVSWMRMLNYEEKILRRFSAVVVLTRPEREFLARYAPQAQDYDHPTGVDYDFFSSTGQQPDTGTSIFLRNFQLPPNLPAI